MKYFAYGSNMSLLRLKARVPSAVKLGMYQLTQHDLRFHKKSHDGSGKCDAYQTKENSDVVIGALFDICEEEKPDLDRIEGVGQGYEIKWVSVKNNKGDVEQAFTYYATDIDPKQKPYDWYLHHVLVGAKESNLPEHYQQALANIDSKIDPNVERSATQMAIYEKNNA